MKYVLSKLKDSWNNIREILQREGNRIGLFLGILLVGVLMFEAGFVQGVRRTPTPIVIEKPTQSNSVCTTSPDSPPQGKTAVSIEKPSPSNPVSNADCHFVGSKNSTLYHLPTCAPAKRIKPENRVCFSSEDDARARGYKPGCLK